MSDKYNYYEFKKIITDFVSDILITFPEQYNVLDKRLLIIYNNKDTKSDKDYSKNYQETKSNNDEFADDECADNECADDECADDECADDECVDDQCADDECADNECAESNKNKSNKSNKSDKKVDIKDIEDPKEVIIGVQEIFDYCYEVYPERFFDILYQNDDIFNDKDVNKNFLPGIDFGMLWIENITDKTRENIWKYLQLILFTIITNVENKNTFGDTAKLFEAINENEFKEKLENTIKGLENIFDISNDSFKPDISNNIFENMPNPEEIHDHINNIMNGKLGQLAKELAEETAKDFDFSEENIKEPKDIFKTLFKNPQKLMSLVKNVGNKLDEKMKSGDIKESELLEEASNMFNNMKDMPGMENSNMKDLFNNLNIAEMMKNMGMMPPGAKFNKNAFNSKMQENMKTSKNKERMRRKLQENREQKEDNLNTENNRQPSDSGHSSKDLDNNVKNDIQNNLNFLFSNGGTDLSKINSDLQKLVSEMKIQNEESSINSGENSNKKKKKRKKS